MHNEGQIKKSIKPLLEVYGELNTSEIKNEIKTLLKIDEEDKELSGTRPGEAKIDQIIRNIVSHQKGEVRKVYKEGFILDKSTKPARFILLNSITNKEIDEKSILEKKAKREKFIAQKVDWDKIRDRNNEVGDQGEEFVMEYEIDRLEYLDINEANNKVQHLSRVQGDGLGYDISSINLDGTSRLIEVKTTTSGMNAPFYISKNEKKFFEVYNKEAFIYRVYNFDRENRSGEVKIITASELFNEYDFDPITWKVTPKI